ncbi:40S ribosomal protein S12-like [Ostrea edulis]|uniref:40S ribosomal protein S12-like n=1 Tax=Ostrea edulis TaxID=37623 RepID=UPI0020944E26|nr:40S ribosomal protein S12-like [Ostrea edulis]XP_056019882.1 40S ribosomal protein S12-like [Ostrea edulis]
MPTGRSCGHLPKNPCKKFAITSDIMTLAENHTTEDKSIDMDKTFKDMMLQAADKGRVTAGLQTSARELQMAPEGVLLCVMPVENGTDDLVHMKHVLIEAHCREHRIPLVKVDSENKLKQLLLIPVNSQKKHKDDSDLSCVIVQVAKEGRSQLERKFLNGCRKHPHNLIIQIPA